MRAREFTINVPISIRIDGQGNPNIDMDDQSTGAVQVPQPTDLANATTDALPVSNVEPDMQQNPVMVSPLQQELELKKAELGKHSPVISKLTSTSAVGSEKNTDLEQSIIALAKRLLNK